MVHILRNIKLSNPKELKLKTSYFWRAVEATTRREFEVVCESLPKSEKLNCLKGLASHWFRFAIHEDGVRRYAVRTNNWSESQNNALKNVRCGPVLDVLLKSFVYTTNKVIDCCERARQLKEVRQQDITSFAKKIYKTNWCFSERCPRVFNVEVLS